MAAASSLLPTPSPLSLRTPSFPLPLPRNRLLLLPTRSRPRLGRCSAAPPSSSPLHALIFDCDGVILESEHLHRQAYNDAFAHFDVRCPPSSSAPLHWDVHFYDDLQNRIGGGKPKMRWYFNTNGWPSSSIFESPPSDNTDREKLIDIIQDWKTERYKEIIRSGTVEPRPGVLHLMDDAKRARVLAIRAMPEAHHLPHLEAWAPAGVLLAVCSAATKSSVVLCLESLLGMDRFKSLDCFLAGDDVKEKKPDPQIYLTAAKKLGISGKNCVVVEDSVIGLQAANGAGMPCIITYTSSTASQDFKAAIATYPDLSNVRLEDLELLLQNSFISN